MESREFVLAATQKAYQQQLKTMYQKNRRESHPEDLRRSLHDYFMFLEQAITGIEEIPFTDAEFSLPELEAMIQYQESIFKKLIEKRRASAKCSSIGQEKSL